MARHDISVSILTYNRPNLLADNLTGLAAAADLLHEIIVVDNSSNDETEEMVRERFPEIRYLRNEVNTGVAGRNRGLEVATGEIIVTLDDDVMGLEPQDFHRLGEAFSTDPELGALCFKVTHFETGEVCNWCHHRIAQEASDSSFLTYEVTEGAVAYRRQAVQEVGGYFEGFFISHEGKDLAYRLMNRGLKVAYDGGISVVHWHAESGRTHWRRYYYDTRNAIWLAVRNMPFWHGFRFLVITLCAMGVYSLRDGHLKYYFKAIIDGCKGLGEIRKGRTPWNENTRRLVAEVDEQSPGFWYKVRLRLFRRGVEI